MAAVKHEVSIHIRLTDEADAMIELLAEANETTKIKIAEDLLHRALLACLEGSSTTLFCERNEK